jgi:photosystem II stability/assembly factor-like uncharacterized protein
MQGGIRVKKPINFSHTLWSPLCLLVCALPASASDFIGQKKNASFWGVAAGKGFANAVGTDGAIFLKEKKRQWRAVLFKRSPFLFAIDVVRRNIVVAVGSAGGLASGQGVILRSTDRGRTFSTVGKTANQPLYEVQFVNGKVGYAAGVGGALLKSRDGGKEWRRLKTGTRAKFWASIFLMNEWD